MDSLVIGPSAMGFFCYLGVLKALEERGVLQGIRTISGCSSGSMLALFLACGKTVQEIFDMSMDINVKNFIQFKLVTFVKSFGFVDTTPIRTKIVELCGKDPTFQEVDIQLYISACCVNTSEIVYFSKESHPTMKVIDAVCMSICIPIMFKPCRLDGKLYVDGAVLESFPYMPMINKDPSTVIVLRTPRTRSRVEKIRNLREYILLGIQTLLFRSTDTNYNMKGTKQFIIRDNEPYDFLNFSACYDTKVKMYLHGQALTNSGFDI
jgi:predicted acylesterase/phospholipase RssA